MSDYHLAGQPDLAPAGRRERVALRQGPVSVTYGELDLRAGRYAAALVECGVVAGDRVLVALPNSVRLFEMLVGAARIGAVTVPVNIRLTDRELRAVTEDASPAVVVGDAGLLARVPRLSGERRRVAVGEAYEALAVRGGARRRPAPGRPATSSCRSTRPGPAGGRRACS